MLHCIIFVPFYCYCWTKPVSYHSLPANNHFWRVSSRNMVFLSKYPKKSFLVIFLLSALARQFLTVFISTLFRTVKLTFLKKWRDKIMCCSYFSWLSFETFIFLWFWIKIYIFSIFSSRWGLIYTSKNTIFRTDTLFRTVHFFQFIW